MLVRWSLVVCGGRRACTVSRRMFAAHHRCLNSPDILSCMLVPHVQPHVTSTGVCLPFRATLRLVLPRSAAVIDGWKVLRSGASFRVPNCGSGACSDSLRSLGWSCLDFAPARTLTPMHTTDGRAWYADYPCVSESLECQRPSVVRKGWCWPVRLRLSLTMAMVPVSPNLLSIHAFFIVVSLW